MLDFMAPDFLLEEVDLLIEWVVVGNRRVTGGRKYWRDIGRTDR